MNKKGFTLLELLIAMAITIIITAAGYTFFNNTFNFSVLHSRTAEMQRETRVAIDMISREIRNAGFGIVEPLTGIIQGAVSPIQASNNVDPDPAGTASKLDRITLVEGYEVIGTLNAAAVIGAATITMTPSTGVNPTSPTIVGKTVTLEGFYTGTVTAVAGGPAIYTLTLGTPLNRAYTTLNTVTLVRTITYRVAVPSVGAEPVLYRNDGGGDQVIASGIEDLQFAYLLSDGTETNAPAAVAPPAVPSIRAVRVSLLARGRDPNASATQISTRPVLEDHAAGASADRYHRRLVTKVVEVRSLGFN